MADNDNRRKLYDNINKEYDLPDYDQFSKDMEDDTKRKRLYDAVAKEYDLPDYNKFSQDMGYGQQEVQTSNPQNVQQSAQIPQKPQAQQPLQPQQTATVDSRNAEKSYDEQKAAYDKQYAETYNKLAKEGKVRMGIENHPNVKMVAVTDELIKKFPILEQSRGYQVPFDMNYGTPIMQNLNDKGDIITPDEAREQYTKILTNQDFDYVPQQETAAVQVGNVIKTSISPKGGWLDNITKGSLEYAYGKDWRDKKYEVDGKEVSANDMYARTKQELYDDINTEIGNIRHSLLFATDEQKKETVDQLYEKGYLKEEILPKGTVLHYIMNVGKDEQLEELKQRRTKAQVQKEMVMDKLKKIPQPDHGETMAEFYTRTAQDGSELYQSDLRKLDKQINQYDAVIDELEGRNSSSREWGHAVKTSGITQLGAWDFGITDLKDAMLMYPLARKVENGENITQDDYTSLKLLSQANDADAVEGALMPSSYNIKKGGLVSAPFTLQFMAGGEFAKGATTMADKAIARTVKGAIYKAAGKKALSAAERLAEKAASNKMLSLVGMLGKDFRQAFFMENTTGAATTGAEILNRRNGTVTETGDGFDWQGETLPMAIYKGEMSQNIELQTEFLGEHFPSSLKFIRGMAHTKVGSAMGLRNMAAWLSKLSRKDLANTIRSYATKGGINGLWGEYMEEVAGTAENAIFIGDQKLSDLVDVKQQWETFGSVALSCIGMGIFGTAVYTGQRGLNMPRYYQMKHLQNKWENTAMDLFSGDEWAQMKEKIDNTPNENAGELLASIVRDQKLTEQQARAAFNYARCMLTLRGMNIGTMKAAQLGLTDDKTIEQDQSYVEGRETSDEDKHDVQIEYEDKTKELADRLGISEQQLDNMTDEELESLTGEDDSLDNLIYDYQNAHAKYQGVIDNADDNIDMAAQQAARQADMVTDKSRGTVRNATIKATKGGEDYGVYIVSGNVATNEDGSINVSESDNMILYYDPQTGKIEHADASRFAAIGEEVNAEEAKNQAIADAKEKAIRKEAGIIDGTVGEGSSFTITDAEGNEHTYEVLADNGDGTAMITLDGNVQDAPASIEDLQKLKDVEDAKKLEAAKLERQQLEDERKQKKEQEGTPVEDNLDYSEVINNDGKIEIADVMNENGTSMFPDAQEVFFIQNQGNRAKVMVLDNEGNLRAKMVKKSAVVSLGTMSVDEYKEERQQMLKESGKGSETSSVEEDRGEEENLQPIGQGAFGNIYNQFKGKVKEAFNFLISHKSGDLLGVFHRDDVGDIDLVWGNDKMGLAHIIGKHIGKGKDFENIDDAIKMIDEVINKGGLIQDTDNRYVISLNGFRVGIRKNFDGTKKNWIVTAIDYNRSKEEKGIATNPTSASHGVEGSELAAPNDSQGKGTSNESNKQENSEKITLEDGTEVPMKEDGNPDFSQLTAKQTAELYDTQFGEDAEQIISDNVKKSKNALDKANNMTVKGGSFVEQKASKEAKDKAIAEAQEKYNSAKAVADAFNERMLAKEEDTPEGRQNLIEKARRKFNRMKSSVKDNAQAVAQLYNDTVGSLLHRLYDGTGIDVFDDTANTIEEYVASHIAPYSLSYDGTETSKGVKQETGLSRTDFAKTGFLAKEGKGKTIDKLAHDLWQERPENLQDITDQDVRNAIIDIITSGETAFGLRNYIQDMRIAQAERVLEGQKQQADELAYAEERKAKEEEQQPTENTDNDMEGNSETSDDADTAPSDDAAEDNNSEMPFDAPSADDAPFSAKDETEEQSSEERQAFVEKNRVNDIKLVDDVIGKKLRKSLERIAKMMGAKIQWQRTDKIGNGWFNSDTNTIYLTLDSSITEGVQFIFGHEMTHEIKTKSPAMYDELKSLVKDRYGEDLYEGMTDDNEQKYTDAGIAGYDRSYYEEETVADAIGDMMNDLNLAHSLALKMSHPLLAQVHNVLLKVKTAFFGTEYSDAARNAIRTIEQVYVRTANGTFESSESEETNDEQFSVREANERFNNELSRYQNGEMAKNEILHLGNPQGVMRIFLPDLPVVMRQRIIKKGSEKKHDVDVSAIMNMPERLSSPLFVFQRSENTIGVLTDMIDRSGKNVCVAIELKRQIQQGAEYLEVNDVRSFHGREFKNIIEPIANNKTLMWVDKEKGLSYLSSASQQVQQEIDNKILSSAANIVRNFENPSISEKKVSNDEQFSVRDANERFNNEIKEFKNKSHKGLMHLGAPSPILKACGVDVDEITLSPKVLNRKLNQHSLTSDDVKDLVNSIQKPIMVYRHGEGTPNIVVITNADIRGNKLSLALELDEDGNVTKLNNVSSIHDKDAEKEVKRWFSWDKGYLENALRWVDKEKVSDWLSSARLNSYSQTEYNQKLSSLAKVLNDFKNPKVSEENVSNDDEKVSYSLRQKPEPEKKGIGYKVFVLGKDGKLYPPMVANPNGAATPVGVWLDADAAPIAGESKTGRPQVKQGGKGTHGGSGKLAYRPGWHLGVIPYALQFNRKDADGNKTLFPKNFVFAEVEYAADKDYQDEAHAEGINANGKYQHSLAGLKHLPTDGYYMYRTNPNPETDPWVITGAMKVNRLLTRAEQAELVRKAGREPQKIQDGDTVTDEVVNNINQEIANAPKFSLRVYHGSGADFTEFDFDHMGEGAGDQVFGWGGYVTSSKEIGKSYANLNDAKNLYEVNIPDDNGSNYLDWYAEAKPELKEKIREYIEKETDPELKALPIYKEAEQRFHDEEGDDKSFDKEMINDAIEEFDRSKTVGDYYEALCMRSAPKYASKFLSSLGYTGFKYPAGTIMGGTKEGDMNYVIFKPEDMQIAEHEKFSLKRDKDDATEFHNIIDKMFEDDFDKSKHLRERYDLGKTPTWMKNVGIKGDGFSLSFKSIKVHKGKDVDHDLTKEEWHELPKAIKEPFAITRYQGANDRFRLYVNINHNGKPVAVGIDVKRVNQGKGKPQLDVNSIKTVFAHHGEIGGTEVLVAYDEKITPQQQALLRGLNFHEYPTIQELSAANIDKSSETSKESGEKFSLRLKNAIDETDTEPTDAQKKSGNYKKGHVKFGGYDYTIENPKGSYRSGVDENGKEWKQKMHDTYGYIRGKFGKDGDHLDMFINDKADLDSWNGTVYIVDQVNKDGSFDEHKVMYGYDSLNAAKEAYLSNYEKGWTGLGNISAVEKADFDKWLDRSNRKLKPFADYTSITSKSDTYNVPNNFEEFLEHPVVRFSIRNERERAAAEDAYNYVQENRPDKYSQYAIVNMDRPGAMPEYMEKKKAADNWRRYYNKMEWGNYKLFDLNKPFEDNVKNLVGKFPNTFRKENNDVQSRINKLTADYNNRLTEYLSMSKNIKIKMDDMLRTSPSSVDVAKQILQTQDYKDMISKYQELMRTLKQLNELKSGKVADGEKYSLKEVNNQSLFDAIHTLYSKGKTFASKLFNMKYFDVAETPDFMKRLGLSGDKFTVRYGVLSRHFGKDGSHDFTESEWNLLPEALKHPFAIAKLSDKKNAYRIYTSLKTEKGEYVVVGADVKNAGRNVEVNSIATIFGRRNNASLPINEELLYTSKEITPEQMSLLSQPNSDQYPSNQELSAANVDNSSESAKNNQEKYSLIGKRGAANLDHEEEVGTRLDNLNVARQMEEAKKDAKAIKMATGWERGADGKWRYETGDVSLWNGLRLVKKGTEERATLGEMLEDGREKDELLAAYPQLKEMPLVFKDMGYREVGHYNNVQNEIVLNSYLLTDDNGVFTENASNVLDHEIQHVIQHIEGFAQGGNEITIKKDIQNRVNYLAQEIRRLKAEGKYDEAKELIKKNKATYNASVSESNDFKNYQSLAGEVEARNVQSRMGMSPEERRKTLAEETEDVARKDQIFLYGDDMRYSIKDVNNQSLFDAIHTLYSKGKTFAENIYKRKFFDVVQTPDFMKRLGLIGNKFTIRYGVISRHFGKDNQHDFTEEEWKQIPRALSNPILITEYYQDEHQKKQKGYRLYTPLKLSDGSYVVVSAEVKNAGRNLEINAINTIFGRNTISNIHDRIIYQNPKITPEQMALLGENDPRQYPSNQELSVANVDNSSESAKNNQEKFSLKDSKADRIQKLRESKPVVITGNEYKGKYELNRESAQRYLLDKLRGDYVIKDTGEKVSLAKKGAKKVTAHSMSNEAHLKSIAIIPKLIENSIFIDEQPAYKKDAQFDSYRYYVTGLKLGGVDYTARLTIGVKNGKSYYDHYLTKIEKGNLIDLINQSDSQRQSFKPTEGAPNTSDALSGVKDSNLISILQTKDKENANTEKYSLRDEINRIVKTAKSDGTYMKAPNGNISKLNEDQWAMVRTNNFKKWFGDWENNPNSASKVIDENGEPLVVYHGRSTDFNIFEKKEGVRFIMGLEDKVKSEGFFFTPDRALAEEFAGNSSRHRGGKANVISCFLNIRRPMDLTQDDYDKVYTDVTGWEYIVGMDTQDNLWGIMDEEGMSDKIKSKGYDGAVFVEEVNDNYEPTRISYCALDANQIKSADKNNGDFSVENNDIRYSLKDSKADRIEKLRESKPVVITGREITPSDDLKQYKKNALEYGKKLQGTYTNEDTGISIQLQRGRHNGGINEVLQHNYKDIPHLQSVAAIPQIIRKSIFIDSEENNDKEKNPSVSEYQHFVCGLKIGNVDYTVRSAIAVDNNGNRYYDHRLTEIEKGKLLSILPTIQKVGTEGNLPNDSGFDTTSSTKLTTANLSVGKDKRLLSILQTKDKENANNEKYSLRVDRYREELNQWKRDNNLPKDAERPQLPIREPNESAADFLKRVKEYRQQAALWATAPTYEQHLLTSDTAQGQFNLEMQRKTVLARITLQDSMLAIRKAQEAIMKEVGVDKLNFAEDAYTAENRSHGKAKNEFEEYNDEFLQPLRKAYNALMQKLGKSYDNVKVYMVAKHGLERNAHIAFKKALDEDYEKNEERMDAYNNYKADIDRLNNDADFEAGRIDFATWKQNDVNIRTKYAPSYSKYRFDEDGNTLDYSGLTALFDADDFESAAADLVKDVEDNNEYYTDELWYATNDATKKILRDSYNAGMMTEDIYNFVRGMYNNYIPLRGWGDTNADQVWNYVGGGKGAFSQVVKEAQGRKSLADDPIAYIENMAESGILMNNRNWVKQHLLLLAENHPTSLLNVSKAWYIKTTDAQGNEEWIPASPQITAGMNSKQVETALETFEKKMEQMAQKGDATQKREHLEISYPQTNGEEREHEVRVMKNGEEYVIYINGDPQLAQAMNNTRARKVREGLENSLSQRVIARTGRYMAAAYTSMSPLFIPSNYMRDLTMTLASTAIREDARYNYLLRRNMLRHWNTFPLVLRYQNGTLREKVRNGSASKVEQMFYDFMMNGGETGFVTSLDVEDLKKKFKNDLKDMNRMAANPKKVGHVIMDSIETLNRAIEDSNRFMVYMTSIEYGRSIDEAVNNAKDVTLNFNRKGTGEHGWQTIRNLYLFINPAIQSLQTLGALAKHHPVKFTAVTTTWLTSGVIVPLVNNLLMSFFGGDDDKDKYWQFTKWDRRNNFIMWVPFTHEFVKIPLAQEFRGFYGIGDMIASKLWGGEKAEESWGDYALDLMGQIVDMLPLDPTGYDGNVAVSLMPNPIRPFFELAFNVDFTGKPLFKDSEYNKYDPNFTKAYVGTPEWLVRISRMVNSIGNDYPDVQQNWIDRAVNSRFNLNNPAVVDHVLSSYLGGAYTMGSQIFGVMTKALNGDEIKMADIPLASKFVSNPDDRPVSKKQGDEFWNVKERHDRAANTISKLKKKAKVDGDYSTLDMFFGSDEYKQYKEDDKVVKKYEEDRKKEKAQETGEEYKAHKTTGEDVYKSHATPKDDFEDMKMKQLYEKLNSFKIRYEAIDGISREKGDAYYKANKAAIEAIEEVAYDRSTISSIKKGFLYNGKDSYDADGMKDIRELRRRILEVLERANRNVVNNNK